MSRHSGRTRANSRVRHQRAERKAARRRARKLRADDGLRLLTSADLRGNTAMKVLREAIRG